MPTSQAAFASSPLARINAARRLAATLCPVRMDTEQEVRAAGYKQPISSLEAYEKGLEAAVAQIDDDREPYLVMREALTAGMWPFIEVWDVGLARVTVGTGKRIGASRTRELVQVSTKGGDLMLPPDTLLVWR